MDELPIQEPSINHKVEEHLLLAGITTQKEMIELLGVSNYTAIKILRGIPVRFFAANRFTLALHNLLVQKGKRGKKAKVLTPADLDIPINLINSPGRPRKDRTQQSELPSPSLAETA